MSIEEKIVQLVFHTSRESPRLEEILREKAFKKYLNTVLER